jgi:hypothetical protein
MLDLKLPPRSSVSRGRFARLVLVRKDHTHLDDWTRLGPAAPVSSPVFNVLGASSETSWGHASFTIYLNPIYAAHLQQTVMLDSRNGMWAKWSSLPSPTPVSCTMWTSRGSRCMSRMRTDWLTDQLDWLTVRVSTKVLSFAHLPLLCSYAVVRQVLRVLLSFFSLYISPSVSLSACRASPYCTYPSLKTA